MSRAFSLQHPRPKRSQIGRYIDLENDATNQGVVNALVPNPKRYSNVKITCSEITAGVKAFTCLIADSAKNGFNGCTEASHSASGTIGLTSSEAKQGVVIALVKS
ncbi:hypothetical protein DAPPUDRAFT_239260 [Daphnia pulex]|uniref:Uncharacterized protein n=1 Tax=Daphnia pulex TaxID=6669 RepID=E9G8S8_DAPPU|nr:hypothetical protein DAPPUDRAFT_239260 [Daphnia pulex]|eukprot:EFX84024.1 hypothetical protein DAPPUDRAFT_239260 [Daphnia pulex]